MIFVDISIIVLLIVSITYCWQLNRKIGHLQNANNDFVFLTDNFNSSIKRADQTLANLKELSGETAMQLQNKIEKANFVINDLGFMNDKAVTLADKLEKMVAEYREQSEVQADGSKEENVVKMPSSKINNNDILKSLNNKSAIESLLKRMQQTQDDEQDNEGNNRGKSTTQKYDQYLNILKKV